MFHFRKLPDSLNPKQELAEYEELERTLIDSLEYVDNNLYKRSQKALNIISELKHMIYQDLK